MKREKDVAPLKKLIQKYMEVAKVKNGALEERMRQSFFKLMGPEIKKYVGNIYLKDQTLFIHIHSSVLKQELRFAKPKLLKHLQQLHGKQNLKELHLR